MAQQAVQSTIAGFHDALPPTPEQVAGDPMAAPDFHRFLAMLREHPAVLRALGLIVELLIPIDQLDPTTTGPGRIRVTSPDLATVSPWTKYDFDGASFFPASGSEVRLGRVDLSGAALLEQVSDRLPPWAVTTFDIDGAVRRLQQAAATHRRTDAPATNGADPAAAADAADLETLPPLRSAGLVLLHSERAASITRRAGTARGRAVQDLAIAELDADDLVLGYRIDIKPRGAPWRSLHERNATYTVNDVEIVKDAFEESHIKPFAATRHGTGTLQTDQVVARWGGWSLAVRRPDLLPVPGRATGFQPATMPFTFEWDYALPDDRLPSLRFGRIYRMRIRVADAAGGGLGVDEPVADDGATDEVTYLRHEPIQPPRVEGSALSGPGSSLLTLVIRSDPATGLDVASFAAGHSGMTTVDTRALLPPTVTMELAEQHEVFDNADDETTYSVALRALLDGRDVTEAVDGRQQSSRGFAAARRRGRDPALVVHAHRQPRPFRDEALAGGLPGDRGRGRPPSDGDAAGQRPLRPRGTRPAPARGRNPDGAQSHARPDGRARGAGSRPRHREHRADRRRSVVGGMAGRPRPRPASASHGVRAARAVDHRRPSPGPLRRHPPRARRHEASNRRLLDHGDQPLPAVLRRRRAGRRIPSAGAAGVGRYREHGAPGAARGHRDGAGLHVDGPRRRARSEPDRAHPEGKHPARGGRPAVVRHG